MSCDIRVYETIKSKNITQYPPYDMKVTAYCGGPHGNSVQFTIGTLYCQLGEAAILDLIQTLLKRIESKDGYSATGYERENIIYRQEAANENPRD